MEKSPRLLFDILPLYHTVSFSGCPPNSSKGQDPTIQGQDLSAGRHDSGHDQYQVWSHLLLTRLERMGCCNCRAGRRADEESPCDVDPNSSEPIPPSYPVDGNDEQSTDTDNTTSSSTPLMVGNGTKQQSSYGSNENIDTTSHPGDTVLDIGDDDRRSNATMDSAKLDVQRGENTGGSKCNLFNTERAVSNNDVSITIVEADQPIVSPAPPTVSPQATPTKNPPPITYQSIERPYYSFESVINCRYSITETSEISAQPDHYNEDRVFFANTNGVLVMAVFDGHDGNKASGLVEQYLYSKFINPDVIEGLCIDAKATLYALITEVEHVFFEKINDYILEKNDIQSTLPKVIIFVYFIVFYNVNCIL